MSPQFLKNWNSTRRSGRNSFAKQITRLPTNFSCTAWPFWPFANREKIIPTYLLFPLLPFICYIWIFQIKGKTNQKIQQKEDGFFVETINMNTRWVNIKKLFKARSIQVVLALVLFIIVGLFLTQCTSTDQNKELVKSEFVGDTSCQSCHAKEHAAWKGSDHAKAMAVANDSTVLGDFDNQTYTADGVTSRFFKKEGKYFINTQGADGRYHDFEIKYTFGHYPLQQYLIAFEKGKMQVTRQSWDSKNKKWFHQYPGQKIPAGDWLHWTGNAQNWNTMCGECHTTNYKKNYDIETDSYQTTFSQLSVSCESCHGPASGHVNFVKSSDYKNGDRQAGSYLMMTKNSTQQAEMITCFPCHARKGTISVNLLHSNDILDNYIPEIPSTEFYYADGQMNDEDFTYASFLQSKMYRHGVKCSNCHNPHSGKLLIAGNGVCNQCHSNKKYDMPAHTFHAVGTEGAQCKNCHMPSKYYMGNDLRHDHIFRVPRPDLSAKYGTPNACNNCHKNKSAQWASDAIVKWYGNKRAYHFAEDLIPGSKLDQAAQSHLIRLLKDTATPSIIQATAIQYISSIPDDVSLQNLLKQLDNKDAQVRYRAVSGLVSFSSSGWLAAVTPMLKDPVRAVRIAVANLLISINSPQLVNGLGESYTKAASELNDYTLYQSDFASGSIMVADYYYKLANYESAEKFYLRGLQKDNQINYARLNLATVYNLEGKNDKALQILQDALKVDDKNDRIYFNLALLYNEMNDPKNVESNLKKAIALKSVNPRVYYNYAILLQQRKEYSSAEQQYLKAWQLAPNDMEINYAICILYLQENKADKAIPYAQTLKRLYPGNQQVGVLLQQMGM